MFTPLLIPATRMTVENASTKLGSVTLIDRYFSIVRLIVRLVSLVSDSEYDTKDLNVDPRMLAIKFSIFFRSHFGLNFSGTGFLFRTGSSGSRSLTEYEYPNKVKPAYQNKVWIAQMV